MLVTEDEARTIRCPLSYGARFTDPNGAEVIMIEPYSQAVMAAPSFCIGTKCMAWRWAARLDQSKQGPGLPPIGFCGMAGNLRP